MAANPARATPLSVAIVELSSLARACRDRVWQRELLDLAAACSAYSKAPRPDEQKRILTKARGLVAAAPQVGQEASAAAASAVIAALLEPPVSGAEAVQSPTVPVQPASTGQATTAPLTLPAATPFAWPATEPTPPAPTTTVSAFRNAIDNQVTEPLTAPGPVSVDPFVVVVDNDPESRRVLATYLGLAGFRVAAFDDGGPANTVIRDERPALVVVDLILPMMPGEMLILALRRSPVTAKIPILVVTAEPWRLGPEHEVDEVLHKPVNVTVVVDAARRIVSAAAGTNSLPRVRF